MLELMSPWEYTSGVRPVLGHGSGFDSPGWNALRRVDSGGAARRSTRSAARRACRRPTSTGTRASTRISYRARGDAGRARRAGGRRRIRHLRVVERIIGGEVVGTQGTPVELLAGLVQRKFFPELWDVRNELTELAKQESGA